MPRDASASGAALRDLRDDASTAIGKPVALNDRHAPHGEYDVIVVGYGLTGACAALEAAASGMSVLLLDRFQGGGSSQMSGGIVYAGGGTHVQGECGVEDSPEAMAEYLLKEVGGLV